LAAVFFTQYREEVKSDLQQAKDGILFEESKWGGTKNNLFVEPVSGEERYGAVDAEVPEQVMRNVTYHLFRDTSNNEYDTYLLGVIPAHKRLNSEKRQKVFSLFEKITGQTMYQVDEEFFRMDLAKIMERDGDMTEEQAENFLRKDYYKKLAHEFEPDQQVERLLPYEAYIPIREDLSYDEFKELLGEIKTVIGRKTADYENLERYGARELTYEEASARYEAVVSGNGIPKAYAEKFSDDIRVVSVLFAALIAMEAAAGGFLGRAADRERLSLRGQEKRRILFRFFAIVIIGFLPILILMIAAARGLDAGAGTLGLAVSSFAFLAAAIGALLPAVTLAGAAGLLFFCLFHFFFGLFRPDEAE
jgi:hypothetical protein